MALPGSSIHAKGIKPVTPADMKGVSIEAMGGVTSYFTAMGANALTLDPGDYYLSLERGVVNAEATHWPAIDGYAMKEITTYHLMFGEDGGGIFFGCMGCIINAGTWNSLTTEQQDLLTEAFKVWSDTTIELDYASYNAGKTYCEDNGQEFRYLSTEEELAPWVEYIDQFNDAWVERVNAAGLPGDTTLAKLHELLEKY
jgi:TRAP-type C4-dicarboxylate transport system substrate-binding protein